MLFTQTVFFECGQVIDGRIELGAYNDSTLEWAHINSNGLIDGWMLNEPINQGRHRQNIRSEAQPETE